MSAGPFSVVASSVAPTITGQWFICGLTIAVRNETSGPILLTTETTISFGRPNLHAFLANLAYDTQVGAAETIVLTFARARVCGGLPPGFNNVALDLIGRDDNQAGFRQELAETRNTVELTESEQEPNDGITGVALRILPADVSATLACGLFTITLQDDYPAEVTLQLSEGPDYFDVLLDDGTPLVDTYVLPEVVRKVDYPLFYRARPGLEVDTVYRVCQLIAIRTPVACWHTGGIVSRMGSGGPIRVVLLNDANLEITGAFADVTEIERGGSIPFHVSVTNPKACIVYIHDNDAPFQTGDIRPGITSGRDPEIGQGTPNLVTEHDRPAAVHNSPALVALRNGEDFSDYFSIPDFPGDTFVFPGGDREVQFHVIPARDTPPGLYELYPTITSYLDAVDARPTRHRVHGIVNGLSMAPPVKVRVNVR